MKNETRKIKGINFIEKAKLIHSNFYEYNDVVYINCDIKVDIMCPLHGLFSQTPFEHLKGHKCAKCAGVKKLTEEVFINKANLKHSNKFDYSKVKYTNNKTKVIIVCKKHGEFLQTPNRHLDGDGCSKCSSIISKPETKWLDYLSVDYEYRQPKGFKIKGIKFKPDAYDPNTNTIYEFYGDFWHGNPNKFCLEDINPLSKKSFKELYLNTLNKEKVLRKNGYALISIWESDWKNMNKFIG